jgi:hypothetical protein
MVRIVLVEVEVARLSEYMLMDIISVGTAS